MGQRLGWGGPSATLTGVTIRADGADGDTPTTYAFGGYASVTGRAYEMWDWAGPYLETVNAGSFTETLSQPGLDVPLVLAHNSLRRIARTTLGTLHLKEDDVGLDVNAPRLDASDPDVAYIAPKLLSRLIDEMSFMFRITEGEWSPDFMEYHINAVDIHRGDVAIVGYGANPFTAGSGLRGASSKDLARDLTDTEARDLLASLEARFAAPARQTSERSLVVTDEDTRLRTPRVLL